MDNDTELRILDQEYDIDLPESFFETAPSDQEWWDNFLNTPTEMPPLDIIDTEEMIKQLDIENAEMMEELNEFLYPASAPINP